MKAEKVVIPGILIGIVALVAVLWTWDQKSSEKFAKSEIDEESYHSLLLKYNYIKGSKQGEDFQERLRNMLSDGMISKAEFKKLTGKEAKLSVYLDPEKAHLYKDAKAKLFEYSQN
ncbi:hypothetical protein MUB04_15725 [Acinetobacter indicus]|uniref:hypothetical protein n=1 Tax=Acinetobacter TaxID=469 RepID=UPI0015D1BD84|nr:MULTISPECIES: hypothetical protein [Acinetobacter]MCP0917987.1 hypothetical protein [Acinetobacter indicus]